jgi:hypothetical protein
MVVTAFPDGDGFSLCRFPIRPHATRLHRHLTNHDISEGVTTVGGGLLFAMIMPEYPHNARLLKPVERDFAVWRLEMEAGAGEAHDDSTTLQGFELTLLDPKV